MLTKLSILLFSLCLMRDNPIPDSPENTCKSYFDKELKKKVYTNVEIEPEFPGGAAAYHRFLNHTLRYPQALIDSGDLQSTAIMKFIVDTEGSISNIIVNDKKDSTYMTPFEKEVYRVIKLMPKWTPGVCQGKQVTAAVKTPLMIELEEEK
jgi:protein TonB